MKTRIKVILISLLLLLAASLVIIHHMKQETDIPPLTTDDSAEKWDGKHEEEHKKMDIPTIAIPGIDSLVFKADAMEQKVNFYNPPQNDCLFLMTLYVGNKQVWKSGYVEPEKGYYDIMLSEPIEQGEYNACLLVQCYKEDGTALNSAEVEFKLYAE